MFSHTMGKAVYFNSIRAEGHVVKKFKQYFEKFNHKVLHSFMGNEQELDGFLKNGFYIALRICSFEYEYSRRMIKSRIPLDRIVF